MDRSLVQPASASVLVTLSLTGERRTRIRWPQIVASLPLGRSRTRSASGASGFVRGTAGASSAWSGVPIRGLTIMPRVLPEFHSATQQVSRPGEFHPQPLVEPYVTVSRHTAPIARPVALP